jgi:hypothetical protein
LNPERRETRGGERRATGHALTDLFGLLFSGRGIIAPEKACATNAFIGVILLLAAVLVFVQRIGTNAVAVFAIAGTVMAMGPVVVLIVRRVGMIDRLLAIHGAVFVALALYFAGISIAWALRASPHASFRYAPGLIVVASAYGALQIALFGPATVRRNADRLRAVGVATGLACEVAVLVCLLMR